MWAGSAPHLRRSPGRRRARPDPRETLIRVHGPRILPSPFSLLQPFFCMAPACATAMVSPIPNIRRPQNVRRLQRTVLLPGAPRVIRFGHSSHPSRHRVCPGPRNRGPSFCRLLKCAGYCRLLKCAGCASEPQPSPQPGDAGAAVCGFRAAALSSAVSSQLPTSSAAQGTVVLRVRT
jgi:hypothetical protein